MNKYKKYCPNVFVAECEQEQKTGDLITITTKYGKENEHIVHNFLGYCGTKENPKFCYSITRADGFNSQERAKNKVEKLESYADKADKKSDEFYEKSNQDRDFLSMAEPIKIGHHSEKRHRRIIEKAQNNTRKFVELSKKAESYRDRTAYWEAMADKIDLSMPESLEYFKQCHASAVQYHSDMKKGLIEKRHAYSLTYAKKKCNELKKKVDLSVKLWGINE